ncbi:MAG: glutamine-hydrolyzing carbamoyl-phosphate synthase small subunit [Pseudomonadota bacterium]
MNKPAVLVLEDGSVFHGTSMGANGNSVGEVVFNTSMTGYQEIITDPSYAKQIVTLTYPHIGNTGINSEDEESDKTWLSGLIIRDLPALASNFRKENDLSHYLQERHIVAIADIDTRRLTRHLRTHGALSGCISTDVAEISEALKNAQAFPGLKGMDLARLVTTSAPYAFSQGEWSLGHGFSSENAKKFKVVAYDFGVKKNILRMLVERGADVTVVPASTSAEEALSHQPDGIFLSNGPGDPEPCDYAIEAIKHFLVQGIPVFGICLGHQLLALATGATTMKMKFGHHGANHPVKDLQKSRVMITSQNHGFAIDDKHIPDTLDISHVSLFDGTIQGVQHKEKPAFGFQGHPEASPGPHDAAELFDHFFSLMDKQN